MAPIRKSQTRQNATDLFAQAPTNGRIPLRQIARATSVAIFALLLGTAFVIAFVLTSDGKPTNGNKWYQFAPTFIAVGAVILRGSIAAILGITVYQNLWQNLSSSQSLESPSSTEGPNYFSTSIKTPEVQVSSGPLDVGFPIRKIESIHLASRLAVGMLYQPLLNAGWILGFFGLLVTTAIQPVLQSAISIGESKEIIDTITPLFHAQLSGAMVYTDGAMRMPAAASLATQKAATSALFGENIGHRFTNSNLTGYAVFGPLDFTDVVCDVEATPGVPVNSPPEYSVYEFTYRDPENEYAANWTMDIKYIIKGAEFPVAAVMNNGTHDLKYSCIVGTARGNCEIHLDGGVGMMGALNCNRDSWIDRSRENREREFWVSGPYPSLGTIGLYHAFLEQFVGRAVMDIRMYLNYNNILFLKATTSGALDRKFILPSDLIPHMKRVLWMTPLLVDFGVSMNETELGGFNIPMRVFAERPFTVYRFDKARSFITLTFLVILTISCLFYLAFSDSSNVGRLMRDSLVHSLTTAGPNGPAIKGACIAPLEEILHKAGGEKLKFGVLVQASERAGGHLGFQDQTVVGGMQAQAGPVQVIGRLIPGGWYGGEGIRMRGLGGRRSLGRGFES